jgi:hypothetical protein
MCQIRSMLLLVGLTAFMGIGFSAAAIHYAGTQQTAAHAGTGSLGGAEERQAATFEDQQVSDTRRVR